MIWYMLALGALVLQQLVRFLKVREMEANVDDAAQITIATGVVVTHTTVEVPWFWPLTGQAQVRIHFDPPGHGGPT